MTDQKSRFDQSEFLRQSQPDIISQTYIDQTIGKDDESVIDKINCRLAKNKMILKLCKKINIEPIYILLIALIPLIVLLFTFFTFTTTMISTLYPLYRSFKTLKYQVNKSKINGKLYKKEDEDRNTTQWLSYWLLYSFINNTEFLMGSLKDKIPLYQFFKFIFLLLCFLPQIKLSVLIYHYFTSKIYNLYGEKYERSMKNLMLSIFGKAEEGQNEKENGDTKDCSVDDVSSKKKKVE